MELKKSREILGQVKEADIQLRKLLGMKDRKSIIENDAAAPGEGGPTATDRSILQKVLSKRLWDISDREIRMESKEVVLESVERIQSYNEISELIAYERGLFRSTPQGWPAKGRMTSRYGYRISPFRHRSHRVFHSGVDIANKLGSSVHTTLLFPNCPPGIPARKIISSTL